jgi:SAM-dependent methyltransferase
VASCGYNIEPVFEPRHSLNSDMCNSCGTDTLSRFHTYRRFRNRGVKGAISSVLDACDRFGRAFRRSREPRPFDGFVARCGQCGLIQLEVMPTPAGLQEFYSSSYWGRRRHKLDPQQFHHCPRAEAQVGFIEANSPDLAPSSILEIGAGAATPSLLLRERLGPSRPVEIHVVEPGEVWAGYYKATAIKVLGSFFPTATDRQFCHVHASHWLEHVTDPQGVVAEIRRVLRPGGTVFIEVPFADDEYWTAALSDVPHTLFFSVASLNHLFARAGFQVLKAGRYGIPLKAYERGDTPRPGDYGRETGDGFWIRALYRLTDRPDCWSPSMDALAAADQPRSALIS